MVQADGADVCLRRAADGMELDNGLVKVRVAAVGGRVRRQYFARQGADWTLVAEAFAPGTLPVPAAGGDAPAALYDAAAAPHRYLVAALPAALRALPEAASDQAGLELRAEHTGAVVVEIIRLRRGEPWVRIEVSADLPGSPARLDYLLSTFTFNLDRTPAFVHTPNQKFDDSRSGPGRDQIIGDRAFHAPAVILGDGGRFAALVPDLDALNARRVLSPDARRTTRLTPGIFSLPIEADKYTMPAGLDLNVRSGWTPRPVFSFGLIDSVIGQHIRFQRPPEADMARTLATHHVSYAFDLFLGADLSAAEGCRRVARHQWDRYGRAVFTRRPHLAMPFEEYARLIGKLTFNPIRDPADPTKLLQIAGGTMDAPLPGYADHGSWLEWELDGVPVGGYRSAIPSWSDVLHNSVWWNNAREAIGFLVWGRQLGDPVLVARARRIVNLCLAAPRNAEGLFATLYNAGTRTWSPGFTDPPHGECRVFLRDAKSYDVAAMSKTGAHLLDYHLHGEPDPRIVAYLAPYANWLLTAIDDRGTVPAYVTLDMTPSPILRDSAHPAASLWFLAEMANATGRAAYREGATRIAAYLEREVLPDARWIDFEQYFSCGRKPLSMVRDDWQHQYFRGNMGIIWGVEGFAALYRATGDARWLRDGEQSLDYLCFYQCCWAPHFIYTAFPFGGFTADNSDSATMLDARQAETVRPFLWYGKELGRQDFLERGVAAARASVVLINHPLHKANDIYRHTNFYPFGFGPENIDHEAHPQSAMRTHPGWGEASGVYAGLAGVLREVGGVYVDFAKGVGVGADGVMLRNFSRQDRRLKIRVESQLARLPKAWLAPYAIELRLEGLPDGDYELAVNDDPVRAVTHRGVSRHRVTIAPAR